MMPPHCTETALDEHSRGRSCSLEAGHDGDHMDWHGQTWEDPRTVLTRLHARWGRTHRIVCTGRLWLATDRNPRSHWRTEVEPTAELLEVRLEEHHGAPSGPPAYQAQATSRVQAG